MMLFLFVLSLVAINTAYAGNWNTNVRSLVTERLDPIVSPNGVASHMHAIIGGSAFGASYRYEDAMKSTCTSFPISVDKSNYWMPQLYWINNGGQSFTPLPHGHRVYYFRSKSSPNSTIQAFPAGLRMLAGNPNSKTANSLAISYICRVDSTFMGPDDVQSDNFNIDKACPNGLLVQLKFPSCWDGVNLYKSDQSHMSYPVSSGATWGACPWSHPLRLPSIMLEYYFQTSKWAPGESLKGNLAWANGDTTGFGAHADFTNGWDVNILQKALVDPVCGADADITFQDCPVFKPYVNDVACSPDKGQMAESSGNSDLVPITALPGCNKLWATGAKPTCSDTPSQPDVTKFQGVDGSLVAATSQQLVLPTVPGWKALGCIQDTNTMLLNETRYNDPNVTQSTCFDSCLRSGYSYAAIGKMWGTNWDCHCGTGVDSMASVYPGMCNLTCPGNPSQGCGGAGAHQVFYAPNATKPIASFTSDLGCYADPPTGSPSLEMQASYNFSSWDKMTNSLCLQGCADRNYGWGAIRAGATCYCGINTAFSLGSGNWVSGNLCNTKCPGNATESCGYWNGANVFNVTTKGYKATTLNKPPGYLYCFSGGNMTLTGTQFYDGSLTPQRCSSSCYELGYSLAAVWNTNMCLCGNDYHGGGQLPLSMCSGSCPGSNTTSKEAPLTCGAQWNIGELYNTSAQASTVQASIRARPAGWQGCYANSDTLLPGYLVSDSKMTVEKCLSSCDELGYAFAGVQGQNQCRCSNNGPTTQTPPIASNVYCNLLCSGNATETCGGWGRAEVYKVTPSKVPGGTSALPGYKGCFNGTTGLTSYSWSNWNNMTVEACTKGCRELGFSLSSLSNRATCSCGNKWNGGSQLSTLSCSYNCTGNNAQGCGGWPAMSSVYDSSVGASVTFPKEYRGCYNDSLPAKILTGYSVWLSDGSSITNCRHICAAKNYTLAGEENSNNCFCGNAISSTAVRQTSDLCSNPCPADSSQKCGAWNYISIYDTTGELTVASSSAQAVLFPSTSTRSLSASTSVSKSAATTPVKVTVTSSVSKSSVSSSLKSSGSSSSSSSSIVNSTSSGSKAASASVSKVTSAASSISRISNSTSISSSSGLKTASVSLSKITSAISSLSSTKSASPSSSNSTVSAGKTSVTTSVSNSKPSSLSSSTSKLSSAAAANSTAKVATVTSSVSSSSTRLAPTSPSLSSSRASTAASSTTSPAVAASAASSSNGNYLGCRASASSSVQWRNTTSLTGMTVDFCRRWCHLSGTTVAALGKGNTCECGSASSLGSASADTACSTKCSGDSSELCGSNTLLSAYSTNVTATAQIPVSYLGCFVNGNSTALSGSQFSDPAMTTAKCESACRSTGSVFYGLHAGNTCHCGKAIASTTLVANSQCSSTCSGGGGSMCGAAAYIALYGVTP